MKKLIAQFAVAAGMVVAACSTASAQVNLGADCGCPTVSTRPVKDLGLYCDANGNLLANTTLYCDTIYTIGAPATAQKIWVGAGKTLTIKPGTVIKTYDTPVNTAASTLIITRDGKINAEGSPTCPIVLTSSADALDGTHPIGGRGEWGGLVIMGRAQVNRIGVAASGTSVGCANGEMFMEGLSQLDSRSIFGGGLAYNNADNSGILKYVSVRYAGVPVATDVELNGISLGAVGSGTTIENIEVISNDDDAIEFWGGTVNVKYANFMFVNDDGYDMDLNYDGKMQFLFGVKAPASIASGGESGFEWDGDETTNTFYDNFSAASRGWRSHPVVYNATIIGNGSNTGATGTGTVPGNPFGISFKSDAEGEIYNSIITGFRGGVNMRTASGDSTKINYDLGLVKVGCNHFVGCTFPASAENVQFTGADSIKFFTTDLNVNTNSISGFDYIFNVTSGNPNSVTDNIDVVPDANISTLCTPPNDGFFKAANYRGAFEAGKKPWLNNWAYTSVLSVIPGLKPCPTDLSGDGVTNTTDFLIFVAQFNLSCN